MNKTNKFSHEVRERAVRMVQEHRGEYPSLWAAKGSQYLSIRYTERLAEAGIEPSVGAVVTAMATHWPKPSTGCTRPS